MKDNSGKRLVYILTFMVISFFLSSSAFAQSAKDAVLALKKLQARTQSGVSYKDYGPALGEAKFPVNLYIESQDAKNNEELVIAIQKAMNHYENASLIWRTKFGGRGARNRLYQKEDAAEYDAVFSLYPDAPRELTNYTKQYYIDIDAVLSFVWQKASDELKVASGLLSKAEAKEKAIKVETEDLKKENENLKNEIINLKNEIINLKNENESLKTKKKPLKK